MTTAAADSSVDNLPHVSSLQVFFSPRFWPLFWTQFLGAFNDNLIKMAAVLMITYQGTPVWGFPSDQISTLAPALLILPALLFAAMAGQLTDKYSKSAIARPIKLFEVGLMMVAAAGFVFKLWGLLMVVILLLGLQSTFFGPLKYSILPQLLDERELVAGNALIESGTNLAILIGTIIGGRMVADKVHGPEAVGAALLVVAVVGYLCARKLIPTPPQAPELEIHVNPWVSTLEILRDVYRTPTIFRAILAISWFWAYAFALVALFVPYAFNVLHADEGVQVFFLALFSIGVAVGSMLCEKLSFDRLELGLVPLGSIGMTVFAADLYFAWVPDPVFSGHALSWMDVLHHAGGMRVATDLVAIAISTGFYIVPLYTFIQARSEASVRSRVVAANNIMNSLFMAVWAGVQITLLQFLSPIHILPVLAVLNGLVALYIYTVIPEFLIRFCCYILVHIMYRVRADHLRYIPADGAAVLVCNHVTFIDWLIISGTVSRPIRFVMHHSFMKIPLARTFFRQAHVIPIATHKEDAALLERAMDTIARELELGELVCIFPEGNLTHDGAIEMFKKGIEHIVERTPVPVVPMALQGLWGSFFSRQGGKPFSRPFHRVWSRIALVAGAPIPATEVKAELLHDRVSTLRGDAA